MKATQIPRTLYDQLVSITLDEAEWYAIDGPPPHLEAVIAEHGIASLEYYVLSEMVCLHAIYFLEPRVTPENLHERLTADPGMVQWIRHVLIHSAEPTHPVLCEIREVVQLATPAKPWCEDTTPVRVDLLDQVSPEARHLLAAWVRQAIGQDPALSDPEACFVLSVFSSARHRVSILSQPEPEPLKGLHALVVRTDLTPDRKAAALVAMCADAIPWLDMLCLQGPHPADTRRYYPRNFGVPGKNDFEVVDSFTRVPVEKVDTWKDALARADAWNQPTVPQAQMYTERQLFMDASLPPAVGAASV